MNLWKPLAVSYHLAKFSGEQGCIICVGCVRTYKSISTYIKIVFVSTLDKTRTALSLPAAHCLMNILLKFFFGAINCKINKTIKDLWHLFQITSVHERPGVFLKTCSENTLQIYRRTPLKNGDFNSKFAAHFQNSFS